MKKVNILSKKTGAGSRGAALYLTVAFVTVAVGLLLILFSVSSSSAISSANAVNKLKNDLAAESAAEELRCALIECEWNEASIESALNSFVPNESPQGFEIDFIKGTVGTGEDCITVSDCTFTVSQSGKILSELNVSYKIRAGGDCSSNAEKVVYFNVSMGDRR